MHSSKIMPEFRSLDGRLPWYFYCYLIIGVAWVDLKENAAVEYFGTAGDVFQTQPKRTVVQFFKICLHNTGSIMVDPKIHLFTAYILGEVDEPGITMF